MLSNFTNMREVKGKGPFASSTYFAHVTETIGHLWWRRIRTREICRNNCGGFWFFTDTGKLTPGVEVEELERSYLARAHNA